MDRSGQNRKDKEPDHHYLNGLRWQDIFQGANPI